ncbi:hypothetical protein [Hymenobacter cheonanensis]|uniref:hypothetical protein n=1 Tax=Hymenobacter sp. CA2-7 TaxID=3063993 RepID=UPI002713B8FF|nr:hypothetical protein [Hymenobacter sp. CA2-7]MDO7886162.1 hypothetical protein [Hymenobacter sp. CA2-7]
MAGLLRLPARLGPGLLFGLLAAGIIATEYAVVHRADFGQHPALPPAVAADLLLVLPGLFYLCVVRRYQLSISTVAAAFGGGLALSHWLLPATALPLLAWAGRLAAVGEVATVAYAGVRVRRIWRGYQAARSQSADFIGNLRAATQPVLGRLTEAIITEVAVLRYALLGPWARPEVAVGEVPFTTYRQSGFAALLATFAGLSVLEMAVAHLLVGHWWPTAAWWLTGLSAYTLLWLGAHGQAVRCRPVLRTPKALVVRVGLAWHAAIPYEQLLSVELLTDAPAPAPGLLNTARLLLAPPNLLLTLAAPLVVQGPYGLRRPVRRLAIYVDEPAALRQLVAASRA